MNAVKNLIKSYFNFSKKELNGIFMLFVLMGIVLVIPHLYPLLIKDQEYDFEAFKIEAERFRASAIKVETQQKKSNRNLSIASLKAEYFEFDPNKLSDDNWLKLGLSPKQVQVIRNYVLKGGKFFKNEDLKKIYSISPEQYSMLEPFIRIKDVYSSNDHKSFSSNYKLTEGQKNAIEPIVELNTADSLQLLNIRGIGPAFASRIIRFRNRLGGFYSKNQLLEVYGIDSLKYVQLKDLVEVNAGLINKINLNSFTFDEIKRHPYLTFKQMNAVIKYRSQHGFFKSIHDLKNIAIMNEEIIRKIEPYIAISP